MQDNKKAEGKSNDENEIIAQTFNEM